jgi:tripeptidyl-peptidase-1
VIGIAGIALVSAVAIVMTASTSREVTAPAEILRDYVPQHWVSDTVPRSGWHHVRKAPATDTVHMIIGVKQTNLHELEKTVLAGSDPNNLGSYGKHLSLDEVNTLIAPTHESVKAVRHWLHSAGISEEAINNTGKSDFFAVEASVQHAEKLLSVLIIIDLCDKYCW